MTKEFGLLFFPSLPASIFNSINLIMPICDPKALFVVLLKQRPPWPCTGKSNMAEQFLNRSRICLRLLLCRGLMQVFCPGILYLLPSPLRQRRVKAVPWPSAHFLHRRRWPRVSSPCLGPTTAAAPLEKKKKDMAQKLWQCCPAPSGMHLSSPHCDCTPVLSWNGHPGSFPPTDLPPGAPKACSFKPSCGHLLLDPS